MILFQRERILLYDGKGSGCKCFIMDEHAVEDDRINYVNNTNSAYILLESTLHAMALNNAARVTRSLKQLPRPDLG